MGMPNASMGTPMSVRHAEGPIVTYGYDRVGASTPLAGAGSITAAPIGTCAGSTAYGAQTSYAGELLPPTTYEPIQPVGMGSALGAGASGFDTIDRNHHASSVAPA